MIGIYKVNRKKIGIITEMTHIKCLRAKLYLSDLKTQSVPRSKHSLLRL